MEDHKWDFALEEAVKELESEYKKKQNKQSKPKHKKWKLIRRLIGKKSARNKNTGGEDQDEAPESGEKEDRKNADQTEELKKKQENNNELTMKKELQESCHSPIIEMKDNAIASFNSPVLNSNRARTSRKQGVAERNETERQVVYRTLKNYNQINKLHDYDLV